MHDGFTIADTVAYEQRHNEANGEDNRDGHSENYSRNWGVEGPTDDPAINDARQRVMRSMLTTLFTSLGTPLLLAGDEFGRSQGGNNNAYCQDNPIGWVDWSVRDTPEGSALFDFTSRLIALRKAHVLLRAPAFLYAETLPGIDVADLEWWDERGQPLSSEDWDNPEGRALAMRRARVLDDGTVEALTLLLNASGDAITFHLPAPDVERTVLVDSSKPTQEPFTIGNDYEVGPQTAVLLRWTIDVGAPEPDADGAEQSQ